MQVRVAESAARQSGDAGNLRGARKPTATEARLASPTSLILDGKSGDRV